MGPTDQCFSVVGIPDSVVPSIWTSGLPIIPPNIRSNLRRVLLLGIILIPLIILLRIILIPWIRGLILVLVLLRISFLIWIGTTLIRVYRIWIIIMVWRRVLLILGPLIENEVSRLWGRLMMMMMKKEGFPSRLCKIFDQKNEMEVMEAVLFDRHLV